MPNGKAGDHPLTDLLEWGHPVFGSPIDDLLIEVDELGGRAELNHGDVAEMLWDLWPKWGRTSGDEPRYASLTDALTAIRNRLADDAR